MYNRRGRSLTHPGKIGHTIVKNILDSGYKGSVFPINPVAGDICGLQSYRHIDDIQDSIDIACTVVPARWFMERYWNVQKKVLNTI